MANHPPPTPTKYSKWIDEYLHRNSLTSYALAPLCGVSQPTIDRIRSGESQQPSRDTIKKLEKFIDTPSPDSSDWQVEEDRNFYGNMTPRAINALCKITELAQAGRLGERELSYLLNIAERFVETDPRNDIDKLS